MSPSSHERGPSAPHSPARLLWVTALSIFAVEAGIMLAFESLPKLRPYSAALLDATLLIIFTLPVAHLTWVRSLKRAVDDHARARAAAEVRGLRDPLTQLPNRVAFESSADREIQQARQLGASFTLVVLDVRRFHQINEALGQRHGDVLLQQVAERLRSGMPQPDLVTRLASDLFGVLLQGVSFERAGEAARRVHQLIEAPFDIAGSPLVIEATSGIAVFPEHGETATLLLLRAETALRYAKEQGDVSRAYQEESAPNAERRVRLFGLLRGALQRSELSLAYQPKVELRTGRIVGAEALLRWWHPQLGMILPAEFIPLAEQTSLIKPMTAWVLEEAIRQVAAWRREGLAIRVAVNLSARNLGDESLPEQLAGLLARFGVGPESITAEVTESAVLSDPERSAAVLEKLCEMGIALSLDDFGTGYSSLTYLRTVPANELKIDRSFVSDVDVDNGNASIVGAVISLAHELGLKVVAEGVETAAVLRRLRLLGCDVAQGYLISRPLPAAQFVEFVKRHKLDSVFDHLVTPPEAPRLDLPLITLPERNSRPALRESLRGLRIAAAHITSDAPPRV